MVLGKIYKFYYFYLHITSLSASVNINTTIQQAEIVAKNTFVQNSTCANLSGQKLLNCLYALSADQIVESIPVCYTSAYLANLPNPPPVGFDQCSLLVNDGKYFIDIFSALKQRLIDIPIIIQTLESEIDLMGSDKIRNMNHNYFEEMIQNFFLDTLHINYTDYRTWTIDYDLYRATVEWIYYTFLSDVEMTCPNHYFSLQAGLEFKSPVYIGE